MSEISHDDLALSLLSGPITFDKVGVKWEASSAVEYDSRFRRYGLGDTASEALRSLFQTIVNEWRRLAAKKA